MIENNENLTLINYLNNSYPEIIKSINKEKYMIDFDNFDLFYKIKQGGEVVGFIALEQNDSDDALIMNECYIVPDKRGDNLFFKSYTDLAKSTENVIFIRKPNKNLVNVLIHNELAFKMQNDIVISYVDFIVDLNDTFKNSKIKHNYKQVKENATFIANLFDLNLSAVLFFDDKHIFSKQYDTVCVCEARKYDLKRYSLRKKLKKIQTKYLGETFNTINDNLKYAFYYFKNLDVNLVALNKNSNKFLNEHPDFEDKTLDKILPIDDFTFNCPFCGELTQKSAIHCHICGLDLEKTLVMNENKDMDVSVPIKTYHIQNSRNYDENDKIQKSVDELRSMFNSEREMKEAFSKVLEATGELALISKESQKEPLESLHIIDFDYLELNRNQYDSKEYKELNDEKSIYAMLKYTNEHPTPWMADYYLKSIDDDAFDILIEKEYITKVMPDKFPELFKDCTVEELIRESESYHDKNTTWEDMVDYFMDWCDYSWVVSQKGMDYLKAHPFMDFFTNNLLDFNIYEFKLYSDKYENELTLEEIGDKYINAKLTKALSNNELDLYLNYVDYYFNLNLSKNNYEEAFIYLIQRIIYEINIWLLKDYHYAFDEALSIRTDYLLFKITKLNIDFDLENSYDKAYNSLKIDKIKFNYADNYVSLKRLMTYEDIYDINHYLLEKSKEEG